MNYKKDGLELKWVMCAVVYGGVCTIYCMLRFTRYTLRFIYEIASIGATQVFHISSLSVCMCISFYLAHFETKKERKILMETGKTALTHLDKQ